MKRERGRGAPARAALLGAASLAALLGGCATLGGESARDGGAERAADAAPIEAPMLDDLAHALVQLHTPRITTVQVPLDADPLTLTLVERLARAGYGIQRVDADQGARHLTLAASDTTLEDGASGRRLELRVGPTRLARSYAVDGDDVRPASALSVAGTRAPLALDDARFGAAAETRHTHVVRTGAAAAPERAPLISLITEDVVRGVAREAAGGPTIAGVNSQRVEVSNLYYDDAEAFGALGDDYAPAERTVVVFANDSMRLGPDGKRQIARFVEDYREGEDLIGLIGCSNGPTALDIGNEGLALGRSRRVSEELVALGVAPERVVDEGCWAPTSARDRFPSRGVIMELLRRPS